MVGAHQNRCMIVSGGEGLQESTPQEETRDRQTYQEDQTSQERTQVSAFLAQMCAQQNTNIADVSIEAITQGTIPPGMILTSAN